MQTKLAVVGGTGAEGSGLALRFAKAGARVLIGSRSLDKAQEAAHKIAAAASTGDVTGQTNMDATVPLEIAIGGRVSRMLMLWDGSAAQQAARLVPEGIRVIAAFHALSADALIKLDQPIDCDVLMCGDDADAKATVRSLASLIDGVRVVDAGPLDTARMIESAAALLISLNLRYKRKSSGMRITGIEPDGSPR